MNTAQTILDMKVPEGRMGLIFMGQAGFILKSPKGELMGIDLYLSDFCERYFGLKRLTPQILKPDEIEFDYLLCSHAHYDHFDPDSVPVMLSGSRTRFYCSINCVEECARYGIPESRCIVLHEGELISIGSFTVLPVPGDHGDDAPDALGLYIRCGEKSFYLAGDTCWREDYAKEMAKYPVDFCAAPINGVDGNMNAEEGAAFFKTVRARLSMPCHFWTFAEQGGDPNAFMEAMKRDEDHPAFILMAQGETILI